MVRRFRDFATTEDTVQVAPLAAAALNSNAIESESEHDDTLVLLFMSCHPALTLRSVDGLTIAEIASAFFVLDATMAQCISRAKQSITASSLPLRLPRRPPHLTAS